MVSGSYFSSLFIEKYRVHYGVTIPSYVNLKISLMPAHIALVGGLTPPKKEILHHSGNTGIILEKISVYCAVDAWHNFYIS
jgi:hypothetical protein